MMKSVLLGFLVAVFASGCGGGNAEGGSASTPSAPVAVSAETASLAFVVVPGSSGSPTAHAATEALKSALISAGYKLVVDPRATHDAEIVARVTATQEQSLFNVQVNGKSDTKERVHLTATVMAHGQAIDEAAADFLSVNSLVTTQNVGPAVNGLSSSTKVAALGRQIREQAGAREHAKQEQEEQAKKRLEEDGKKRARVEEEADWNRARVTACRQPTSLAGCDGVRTYLAKYPEGTHVTEAQAALTAAEPLMDKLQKDENAWKTAGVETCKTDHTAEACAGVDVYRTKFPGGMHIDEAQALMRRVP